MEAIDTIITISIDIIGGTEGKKGLNLIMRRDGSVVNLGAKQSYEVNPGVSNSLSTAAETLNSTSIASIMIGRDLLQDTFHLETPGGGGWGNPNTEHEEENSKSETTQKMRNIGGSLYAYQQNQIST